MNSLRRSSVVVALVLASVLVIVAAPAFATPFLTASSGTRNGEPNHRAGAVAPFITPSSGSNSQWTARSTDAQMTLPLLRLTLSCRASRISGYSSITHTEARLTSVSFGDGSRTSCTINGSAVDSIGCTATTRSPWHLHITGVNSSSGERTAQFGTAVGSINVSSPCVFRASGSNVTIDGGQSCLPDGSLGALTYTWNVRTGVAALQVSCDLIVTIQFVGSATANLTALYNIRSDTLRSTIPSITSAS
jgi:hypothetical protein